MVLSFDMSHLHQVQCITVRTGDKGAMLPPQDTLFDMHSALLTWRSALNSQACITASLSCVKSYALCVQCNTGMAVDLRWMKMPRLV